MITTISKSFDTNLNIALTSRSITLSVTGIGLIAIPISASTSCGLSIGNIILYEIIMQEKKQYKNNMTKINKQ